MYLLDILFIELKNFKHLKLFMVKFQDKANEILEVSQLTQYNVFKYNKTTTVITAIIIKPSLVIWGVQFVFLVF